MTTAERIIDEGPINTQVVAKLAGTVSDRKHCCCGTRCETCRDATAKVAALRAWCEEKDGHTVQKGDCTGIRVGDDREAELAARVKIDGQRKAARLEQAAKNLGYRKQQTPEMKAKYKQKKSDRKVKCAEPSDKFNKHVEPQTKG